MTIIGSSVSDILEVLSRPQLHKNLLQIVNLLLFNNILVNTFLKAQINTIPLLNKEQKTCLQYILFVPHTRVFYVVLPRTRI